MNRVCRNRKPWGQNSRNAKWSRHVYVPAGFCHLQKSPVHSLLPLRESPLLHTPSLKFFLTTFFTSSSAWGSSGVLKHVRWEPSEEHWCHKKHMSKEKKNCKKKNPTISSPGRSWAQYHWESRRCPSPTLWRFESGLLHRASSSRTDTNQRLL